MFLAKGNVGHLNLLVGHEWGNRGIKNFFESWDDRKFEMGTGSNISKCMTAICSYSSIAASKPTQVSILDMLYKAALDWTTSEEFEHCPFGRSKAIQLTGDAGDYRKGLNPRPLVELHGATIIQGAAAAAAWVWRVKLSAIVPVSA